MQLWARVAYGYNADYTNNTSYFSSLDCGHEFDYLFLQFYNNYCYPGSQYFVSVVDTWLNWAQSIPNGPLIVLGLPAGPEAAGKSHYYFPPDKLAVVYKVARTVESSVKISLINSTSACWMCRRSRWIVCQR